jgi:lipoprotein-anchoring transpeptidase ErfK/SrfK
MRKFYLPAILLTVVGVVLLVLSQIPTIARPSASRGGAGANTLGARAAAVPDSYFRVSSTAPLQMYPAPSQGGTALLKIGKGEIVRQLAGPLPGNWYRVSYNGTIGYALGDQLTATHLAGLALAALYPRLVVVSLARQQLEAYTNGTPFLITAVSTGRPELPTPTGTFSVLGKYSPKTFISPWPKGSPFHYLPTTVQHAMLFRAGGFYLHDASWKKFYGYGANVLHRDPDDVRRTGSHGCVDMPPWAAAVLYSWITVGTPVIVTAS